MIEQTPANRLLSFTSTLMRKELKLKEGLKTRLFRCKLYT
ncbi:hypothetical protein HMPREF3214_00922 [Alloscardovia omnicolens]|uniref:Uncharacterized protein n=1 Tax=Alloscardovia omnicolens F0580 TaxID=1321816 RepID=U1QQP0_9BIFI|nr:hypothetical protein HMPREF9244_01454 [Alloscardovia omnicolens F0580]KWZ74076.1 hypothetical protein HMPREF3214_00922 [Alloscardovia omnicolens]